MSTCTHVSSDVDWRHTPVLIQTFHPTTWLSDRRNKSASDSPLEAENRKHCHRYCTISANIIRKTNIRQKPLKIQWWKWRLWNICYKTKQDKWSLIIWKVGDLKKCKFVTFVTLVIIKIEILITIHKCKNWNSNIKVSNLEIKNLMIF